MNGSTVCSPVVVLGCLCGISDLSQHLPPVATHHSGTLKGRVATLARCTGYQECSCHLLVSNRGIRLPFDDQHIILLYTGCILALVGFAIGPLVECRHSKFHW